MDSALDRLDAARFLQIWQYFDKDDKGYIEGKKMDDLFKYMLQNLGMKTDEITEDKMRRMRDKFVSPYDSAGGNVQIQERDSAGQQRGVHEGKGKTSTNNRDGAFLRYLIWRNYDTDSSGYISSNELMGFLQDLFLQHRKSITPQKLEEYTDTMMKMFDKNRDGRLDLNDMARILALNENFLLKFRTDACSVEDRKKDFEKIFAHYDVSKTGELEGPEVDGFVKDMMELVKPSISGMELDKFRTALMGHCDINRDGKIQKNELALCLGLKLS
ncbi:secretagogin-like isoform X2 [Girardinichthys multiradiatus]|uniref:secretagogin-like isoform X2 n=1 Tax=Girardinichthys multiradiatus TaxID=208333 RepID=UPI001FAC9B60|nr:secretagogin-like isoform X2 [Girardinichthys multiradiatus]